MRALAVRDRDGCRLHTPFDALFVAALKAEVSPSFRKWEPVLKTWQIDEPYVDVALRLAGAYFVLTVDDRRRTAATPAARRSGSWADLLFSAVPERLHSSVYRALSRALHPDTGGDATAMTALNNARARLPRKAP